jgi:hypothetical protein
VLNASRHQRKNRSARRLNIRYPPALNASRHQRKNRDKSTLVHSAGICAQRLAASEEKSLRASNPPGIHMFAIQVASITPFLRIFGGAGRN